MNTLRACVSQLMEGEQAVFNIFNSRNTKQLEAEENESYLLDSTDLNLRNVDLH